MHAKYVLLPLAEKLTGYTVKAMEQKIDSGVWLEGEVWMRSPDGRRHIIMEGYRARSAAGRRRRPVRLNRIVMRFCPRGA